MGGQPAPTGFLGKLAGGLNRFSDELINPTTGLGKLGMYLGAASGGTLGQAALAAREDQQGEQLQRLKMLSLLADADDKPSLQKELESAGILPGSDEYKTAVLNATSRGLPSGWQIDATGTPRPLGGILTPEQIEANRDERDQARFNQQWKMFLAAQDAAEQRQSRMFAHSDANRAPKYEYRTGPDGRPQRRRIN